MNQAQQLIADNKDYDLGYAVFNTEAMLEKGNKPIWVFPDGSKLDLTVTPAVAIAA